MCIMSGTNNVDSHIGGRIKLARIAAGKSLEFLATELSIDPADLSLYEQGARRVPQEVLFDLVEILQKPLSYFFDDLSSREN